MAASNHARITLVGAGPGDPELITLKGMRALQGARAVLYDALVHTDLLDFVPAPAPRIYVGKRAGNHRMPQEQINELLVDCALRYGQVVRLKGGDPFVFGRGYEELQYASERGIDTAVVPGLSSATALPGLQGMPLTSRGVNESFWVLAGTTRYGKLSRDLELAVRSTATVVILMGMRRLPEIAECFRAHGKADQPAMVVQNGSLPEARSVVGAIDTIHARVVDAGLGGPGLIVVGPAVNLHPAWNRVGNHQKIIPT